MTSRITHPRPSKGAVTDRYLDITFIDGVTHIDLGDKPRLRKVYLSEGYKIEDGVKQPTHAELIEAAGKVGVEVKRGDTKAMIQAKIDEAAIDTDPATGESVLGS